MNSHSFLYVFYSLAAVLSRFFCDLPTMGKMHFQTVVVLVRFQIRSDTFLVTTRLSDDRICIISLI